MTEWTPRTFASGRNSRCAPLRRLRRLLESMNRVASRGPDPLSVFEGASSILPEPPIVIWNVGGAADLTPVSKADEILRRARAASGAADVPPDPYRRAPAKRPVLLIVSDKDDSAVPAGLERAVAGDENRTCCFGNFPREAAFRRDCLHQFRWRESSEDDAATGTADRAVGVRNRAHVSLALPEGYGRPVLLVYLHMDNRHAWERILRRLGGVDILYCTRRGASPPLRHPKHLDEADLWNAILSAPKNSRPRFWTCDAEVFVPPAEGLVVDEAGIYGKPGLWIAPWAIGGK